jgi:hypothetical protein
VREERRARLVAITTTRDGLPMNEAVAAACRPVMVRCRATLTVGTAATSKPLLVQPAHAVAKGARRHVGEQSLELVLAYDPERAQEIEQATVEIGQRAIGITTTTRSHDTNAVARRRARQSRPPEQE